MERKLASIRRVKKIVPIEGAENIELALVDGWQVVVKKGDFAEGCLAVFCEIDSFIPTAIAPFLTGAGKPPSEFNGVQGERLKTTKRMKQLSQGLLLPIKDLPSVAALASWAGDDEKYVGMDVTETLGIQKWEAAEERANNGGAAGQKTRAFPYFLRKTDQERAQNMGHMIERALDEEFEVTVKKDGSSLTVFRVDPSSPYYKDAKAKENKSLSLWQRFLSLFQKDEPVVGLCSRNMQLATVGESNFHKAAGSVMLALLDDRLDGKSLAVQGEVVAPDIQGNYEKVKGVEFHMFDLFDIDKQEYVLPDARRTFAHRNGINHATVVAEGTLRSVLNLKEGEDVVSKLLTYASGEGDNKGVMREGIVAKSKVRDFSFKAISNEYLLKKG